MFKSKFLKNINLFDQHASYTLNNGVKIPVLGFGTWQVKDGDEAYQSVLHALKSGYRHIDTAESYGNEESVGRAIHDSGIPRHEIFVTTKLANRHLKYEDAKAAIEASLKRLGLDYIDLYLIHWPNPLLCRPDYETRNKEVYKAMEEAYHAGKIKALGISNFRKHHLDALLKYATITPSVNQLLINPSDMEETIVAYNESLGILTEAYSPLGTGRILKVEFLNELSRKYDKSVGQIVLRWSLQHGYLPLPKSVTPKRIEENYQVFTFELEDEDMKKIDALHGVTGFATDPDLTNW